MSRTRPHTRRHLLACAAALMAAALALPGRPARAETFWADGYELEVTLAPTRAAFVLGEPVTLALKFENRSGSDVELLLSGEREGDGWPDDFEITVVGPDGGRLPRPDAGEDGLHGSHTNMFLRAARGGYMATLSTSALFPLTDWAKIEKPGRYAVTFRRGLRAGPYGRRYRLFPGTTKPAVELRLTAEFEVVGGGAEGLGKLVEELGASVLACDPHESVAATTRLGALKDGRAVRHLVGAVQKCKNPSIRYQALGALSKYETDEAFEGLRLAASDADEDFRTVVAQSLAQSKHPKARALLLTLRKDPYYGVRLMVLNALESWDTAGARRLIWEMTGDEHPKIREEALRFLQERAGHPPRRR